MKTIIINLGGSVEPHTTAANNQAELLAELSAKYGSAIQTIDGESVDAFPRSLLERMRVPSEITITLAVPRHAGHISVSYTNLGPAIEVTIATSATVADVKALTSVRAMLGNSSGTLRCYCNDALVNDDQRVADGDKLMFCPATAGDKGSDIFVRVIANATPWELPEPRIPGFELPVETGATFEEAIMEDDSLICKYLDIPEGPSPSVVDWVKSMLVSIDGFTCGSPMVAARMFSGLVLTHGMEIVLRAEAFREDILDDEQDDSDAADDADACATRAADDAIWSASIGNGLGIRLSSYYFPAGRTIYEVLSSRAVMAALDISENELARQRIFLNDQLLTSLNVGCPNNAKLVVTPATAGDKGGK